MSEREISYTSIRATPKLVGRTEILKRIEEIIRDTSQSYIVYITGGGGIGKTRVVKYVLTESPKDIPLLVASNPIDLYHAWTHSREGLINAVQMALSPDGIGFETYLRERDKLERYKYSPEELDKQRTEMVAAFVKDLNRLGKTRRLVLALDTAEKLFYESDPVQQRLRLEEERIAILDWLLKDFMPQLNNAVILFCGRPDPGYLRQALEKVKDKQFVLIDLQGLNEEEALAYFDAVAEASEATKKPEDIAAAKRIRLLSEGQRRAAFYCLCDYTQGGPSVRPIWLALAIDHLVVTGKPLPELTVTPAEARSKSEDERHDIRQKLGGELVKMLKENRRPAHDVILGLGWALKGMDAALLSRVIEWHPEQTEQALDNVCDLSFIKIRPDDKRFFLHDEMYDVLQRHVLRLPEYEPRARKTLQAILDYYKERTKEARGWIADLYRPLEERTFPDPVKVINACASLQDALVEDLHYRLRHSPAVGFQVYFQYAEEAVSAGDESLDMQLRAELLGFLSAQDPAGTALEIDGLRRSDVEADAAIRWIKRLIAREEHARALEMAGRLRTEAFDLIQAGGDLAKAELDVWEAQARAYTGQYEEAEQLLTTAIGTLEKMPRSLRQVAILARAYNNLGYVHRSLGRHQGAIRAYQRALPLWRLVKIESEHANTLTNLAFALAAAGEFGDAWRQGIDGLELRRRLGPRSPVGLSLNTLAHLAIEADALDDAMRYLDRALPLFTTLESRRGRGLALTALAEAKRRISTWRAYSPGKTAELLSQAAEHAEEAAKIFDEIQEPARQVEALIEVGCAYRDWAKFRRDYPDLLAEKEKAEAKAKSLSDLTAQSQQALQQAAQIAEQLGIRYRQVDAMVNLAWLHYYVFEDEKAIAMLDKVTALIPQAYGITPYEKGLGGLPILDKEKAIIPFWAQLGKAELLRGQIAFNRFARSSNKDIDALKETAEHYTLSLAYDTQFSDQEFRDMRRAMDRIYERLKPLNAAEMLVVYDAVADVEKKYNLGESRMKRFLERNFGSRELLIPVES